MFVFNTRVAPIVGFVLASDCWVITISASCRYSGLTAFTGSVEALGKLTQLTALYVGAGVEYSPLNLKTRSL